MSTTYHRIGPVVLLFCFLLFVQNSNLKNKKQKIKIEFIVRIEHFF